MNTPFRRILVVSDDSDRLRMAKHQLQQAGHQVLCARLTQDEDAPSSTPPYIGDVIRQCKAEGSAYDGLLLYDMSLPEDGFGTHYAFNAWETARLSLESLDSDMEPERIRFTARGGDPVALSVRQEALQRTLDDMHVAAVEEQRAMLTRGKSAAEAFLLRNPPSGKGIDLIRFLRADDSPFPGIAIAVSDAFPDRKQDLIKAGATLVHTTADPISTDCASIMKDAFAIRQSGSTWLSHQTRNAPGIRQDDTSRKR